jgi:hypothetical protein
VFLGYFFAPAKKSLARLRAKALHEDNNEDQPLKAGFQLSLE